MPGIPDHSLPAPGLWIGTITRTAMWWSCATLLLWLRPEGPAHPESIFWFALVASPVAVLLLAGAFRAARLRLGLTSGSGPASAAGRLFSAMEIALTMAVAAAIAI